MKKKKTKEILEALGKGEALLYVGTRIECNEQAEDLWAEGVKAKLQCDMAGDRRTFSLVDGKTGNPTGQVQLLVVRDGVRILTG